MGRLRGRDRPEVEGGKPAGAVARDLAEILAEHVGWTGRAGDELLFGRTAREPFTPSFIRKRASEAWAVAAVGRSSVPRPLGFDPMMLHELRHSYSTFLDAAGISETRADR
jgi:hypothetical protein